MTTVAQLPHRMSLSSVQRGRIAEPMRVTLYGPEGIGKSTFGSNAPSPIFLGAEDGTAQLDVHRFPEPRNWVDVQVAIRELAKTDHDFKTLVVDTLDWIEPLIWRHICDRDQKQDIEAYGYGKGYNAALDEWRVFVYALEKLRHEKQMHIVLLAHAAVRTFKNPEGEDFDRYTMKINEKAAGLLREWCNVVLFTNYETHVLKEKNQLKAKAYSKGARVMHTERRAAWEAKNRFGLPPKMPLSWDEFFTAAALSPEEIATKANALRAEIATRRDELGDPKIAQLTDAYVAKAGNNLASLSELNNRLAAKLAEKDQGQL